MYFHILTFFIFTLENEYDSLLRLCPFMITFLLNLLHPVFHISHSPPTPPFRQQALLAAISEKDANIALLELSSSKRKKAQEEVMALKREKDRLMHQLKQQVHAPHATTSYLDMHIHDESNLQRSWSKRLTGLHMNQMEPGLAVAFQDRRWLCESKQGHKFKPAADGEALPALKQLHGQTFEL